MSEKLYNMDETAKALGPEIGRNRLFKTLRAHKILNKRNIPYQYYIDKGYFQIVRESFYKKRVKSYYLKAVVTVSGLDFVKRICSSGEKVKIVTASSLEDWYINKIDEYFFVIDRFFGYVVAEGKFKNAIIKKSDAIKIGKS